MKTKDIVAILRSEKYYRNVVRLHNLESGNVDVSEVQNNTHGNSTERRVIKKITDKEYLKALKYCTAIDNMLKNLTEREYLVYVHRYRYGFQPFRIAYEIQWSEATVWQDLKKIHCKFIENIDFRVYN
ncbi:hypothetical protein HZY83_07435 [Gemella sp. GH3]|uniref:hypothetical protein n=1 Tax=unclassified Gemella TaxID=2624949 RepID=UPI0015D08391|nr:MULTISPECIES: hypothetical protein [unclassified Gemella]MBF0714506.1 hypothetical protein [Gemella sp. GH3.1]NYS51458.1 hypothetical protein [Gemella sp. GH3]